MEQDELGYLPPVGGQPTGPDMGLDKYLNEETAPMEPSQQPMGSGMPNYTAEPFSEPEDDTGAVGPLPDVPVAPYHAFMSKEDVLPAFNKGGSVPVYANDGEMMNHPFDREGKEFDVIDAKLTPGEYVIDADSTHVFEPILKKINEWEPGDKLPLAILSPKGEEMIMTKKMADGKEITIKSGKDHEMTSEDEHAGLVYRNDGGDAGARVRDPSKNVSYKPGDDLTDPDQTRLRGPKDYVNPEDYNSGAPETSLRPRARPETVVPTEPEPKETQLNSPEAHLTRKGDIAEGAGRSSAKTNIRSAGGLNSLRGRFATEYAGNLAREQATKADYDRLAKEQKALKAQEEALRDSTMLAVQAYDLVPMAARAMYAFFAIEESWNAWARTRSLIPYADAASVADGKEAGVKDDYRNWSDKTKENSKSASARSQLISSVTNLTTDALDALGPGPKTDFDFIVAGRTVADLTDSPTQIRDTLQLMVDKGNEWLLKEGLDTVPFEIVEGKIERPANLGLEGIIEGALDYVSWVWKPGEDIPASQRQAGYPYTDMVVGDLFVDSGGIVYKLTSKDTLTQEIDSATTSKGTVYDGGYLNYDNDTKKLYLWSLTSGGWVGVDKVIESKEEETNNG